MELTTPPRKNFCCYEPWRRPGPTLSCSASKDGFKLFCTSFIIQNKITIYFSEVEIPLQKISYNKYDIPKNYIFSDRGI
jgi:hypothetical protein